MARRITHPSSLRVARLSSEEMRSGITRLRRRIDEVKKFDPTSIAEQYNIPEITALSAAIDDSLIRTFHADTVEYNRYKDASYFDNGPHNYAYRVDIREVHQSLNRSKARSLALLEQAVQSLEEQLGEENAPTSPADSGQRDLSKIFIVHGHDGAPKAEIARFVEKLGFEAIILHERPNKGRTVITKFREEAAGVGFAVVLMTPDDLGKPNDASEAKLRARQNVVFELGYFIGKLGPERVAALVKGEIELPSDFDGVVYISLDRDDWQAKLGSELQAADYDIDWNKVMRR
jgi:predicted nucleotide-binding protein